MVAELGVAEAQALHTQTYGKQSVHRLDGPRQVLAYGEEGYPESLLNIADPPAELFAIGNTAILEDGLAVIGARKATPYGKAAAKRFASRAAEQGITIISGGAIGCDSVAHEAALSVGGKTVVVLGGGCDMPYPTRNIGLFQRVIDEGGVVISERHWEFPALPYTFRARNRIIAALARATLIVEAGLPSGTFSTADDALAANREVLVVPGPITSPTSYGVNRLLYQGAIPVVDDETFDDIIFSIYGCLKFSQACGKALRTPAVRESEQKEFSEERQSQSRLVPPVRSDASAAETKPLVIQKECTNDALLAALCANPMYLEQILSLSWDEMEIRYEGDRLTWLMMRLASYERDGLIARFPDGRYGPAKV